MKMPPRRLVIIIGIQVTVLYAAKPELLRSGGRDSAMRALIAGILIMPAELRTNVFEGRVAEVYDRGLMFQSIVNIADDFSVVNLTMRRDFLDMNIAGGSLVYLHIDENSVHIIERGGDPKTEKGQA